MNEEYELILQCYRSGQMSEAQWQKHLNDLDFRAWHYMSVNRSAGVSSVAAQPSVPWENFPGYLIDHCEGDMISEEVLQHALSSMLQDPQYSAPTPPADGQAQQDADKVDAQQAARDLFEKMACVSDDEKCIGMLAAALSSNPGPAMVGDELNDEVIQNPNGATWMGMPVRSWRWKVPAKNPDMFPPDGMIIHHATHWSTGPKDAERLYRESDIRALLKRVQPASGEDARDAARYRWLRETNSDREDLLRVTLVSENGEDYLDAAIDAAMQQGGQP